MKSPLFCLDEETQLLQGRLAVVKRIKQTTKSWNSPNRSTLRDTVVVAELFIVLQSYFPDTRQLVYDIPHKLSLYLHH